MTYDYLIVGAGFFGATFARLATDDGKTCLVIDSRNHIAGNAYSEKIEGIDVHMYGPHIFHTNNDDIWKFANRFTQFNNFVLSPKVSSDGKLYSLPFNMNTYYELWGCTTPAEAQSILKSQTLKLDRPAVNLEEHILAVIEVRLNTNYFDNKSELDKLAKTVVFTGKIDEYYDYADGELEYRSLDFQHEILQTDNYQGSAIFNYPSLEVPWTRIIEHKHFTKVKTDTTVITKEIPTTWGREKVPYYPINDAKNTEIYNKYRDRADSQKDVIFGGRLSEYRYYDMHQVIASAIQTYKKHK